jgi:hypothetical protein
VVKKTFSIAPHTNQCRIFIEINSLETFHLFRFEYSGVAKIFLIFVLTLEIFRWTFQHL